MSLFVELQMNLCVVLCKCIYVWCYAKYARNRNKEFMRVCSRGLVVKYVNVLKSNYFSNLPEPKNELFCIDCIDWIHRALCYPT